MLEKFIDQSGLSALKTWIKEYVDSQGGQQNLIETVKLNGTALEVVNKSVDVPAPTIVVTDSGVTVYKQGLPDNPDNAVFGVSDSADGIGMMFNMGNSTITKTLIAKAYADAIVEKIGNLSSLTTTDKTDIVSAINELKSEIVGMGEPFRVKQYQPIFDVTIDPVTTTKINTDLPKIVLKTEGQEAEDFQIAGMIAYEVFDSATGGNRLNYIPVCQFTGQNQTELSIRGVVAGTTSKVAKRVSCWILLKHR